MSLIRSFIYIIIATFLSLMNLFRIIDLHIKWQDHDLGMSPPNERKMSYKEKLKSAKAVSDGRTKKRMASYYGRIDSKLIRKLSKPFHIPKSINWCIPQNSRFIKEGRTQYGQLDMTKPSGLLYVKVPKTGSSVIASVLERISRTQTPIHNTTCALMYTHDDRHVFMGRNKEKSIMIGSLRDPIKRSISRAFFSPNPYFKHTDVSIMTALQRVHHQFGVATLGKGGFQLNYMNFDQIGRWTIWKEDEINNTITLNHKLIEHYVRNVMYNYQFIFLNERLDEGLVLLKLLLNLRTSDLLYLSSKVGGGYYSWQGRYDCIKLTKSFVSPAVSKYVSTEKWFLQNYGDYLLYSVANKSMDLTIESIGRRKFNEAYDNFLSLRKLAETKCKRETILPCSADGRYHNKSKDHCYSNDIGCGWPCFDKFVNHTLDK